MSESIRYHELFECNIREAALWYESRSKGLGLKFKQAVRKRVDEVLKNPLLCPKTERGTHYAKVHRFPYVILYRHSEGELYFLTVLHTARSLNSIEEQFDDQ